MPNIRVTCPACKSELEIDSAHEGQEIECGGCLQVFTAQANKPEPDAAGRSGAGGKGRGSASDSGRGRSARGSRRRDDDDDYEDDDRKRRRRDDDDYEDDDYEPRRAGEGPGAVSVVALVLGILSTVAFPIACCGCCSILSWPVTIPLSLSAIITGAFGLKDPKGKPMAIIGMILGGAALGFILIQLVVGFGPLMVPPQVR